MSILCVLLSCTFITIFVNLSTHPLRKLTMVLLQKQTQKKPLWLLPGQSWPNG